MENIKRGLTGYNSRLSAYRVRSLLRPLVRI